MNQIATQLVGKGVQKRETMVLENSPTPINTRVEVAKIARVSDKAKVKEAIRLFLRGMSHRKIAEHPDVSQPTISSVIREYTKRKELISEHLRSRGHLKSVVNYPQRGPWGDAKFPGKL